MRPLYSLQSIVTSAYLKLFILCLPFNCHNDISWFGTSITFREGTPRFIFLDNVIVPSTCIAVVCLQNIYMFWQAICRSVSSVIISQDRSIINRAGLVNDKDNEPFWIACKLNNN